MFEITVAKVFAASHAIRLPDDTLEPLHGHNWDVRVTVAAEALDAIETVMDFHELERLVDGVINPWHNRHLNDLPPFQGGNLSPSAERVASWIGQEVARQLPGHVALRTVSVGEAPGCTATYRP